jgi:hypothetical protein
MLYLYSPYVTCANKAILRFTRVAVILRLKLGIYAHPQQLHAMRSMRKWGTDARPTLRSEVGRGLSFSEPMRRKFAPTPSCIPIEYFSEFRKCERDFKVWSLAAGRNDILPGLKGYTNATGVVQECISPNRRLK